VRTRGGEQCSLPVSPISKANFPRAPIPEASCRTTVSTVVPDLGVVGRCESRPGSEESGPLVTSTLRTTIVPLSTATIATLRSRRRQIGADDVLDAPSPTMRDYYTILGYGQAPSVMVPARLSRCRRGTPRRSRRPGNIPVSSAAARVASASPCLSPAGCDQTVDLLRRMGTPGPDEGTSRVWSGRGTRLSGAAINPAAAKHLAPAYPRMRCIHRTAWRYAITRGGARFDKRPRI
jgi:hypothetical protein